MSRGFVKEGDQEEVPMVLPRAFLPQGVPNYVTPEGLKLLHDEMESLKKELVETSLDGVSNHKSDGVSDNENNGVSNNDSNYITKNYLDAKMLLLSERISTAVLIDPAKANPDVVSFGMYVKYNDRVVRIVGVDEADVSKGLISFVSPIAKALIGKKRGDKFEIKVPRGIEIVEIQEISIDASLFPVMTHIDTSLTRQQVNKTTRLQDNNLNENKESTDSREAKLSDSQVFSFSDSKEVQSSTTNSQSSESVSVSKSESVFNVTSNPTEFVPLVNEQGNIVGRALYCEIHNGNKVLHPAVHLLVYNSNKEIVGRYWWHVAFGETAEKTLKRRIKEITSGSIKPKFKKQYIRETKNEKELVSVFTTTYDGKVLPTPHDKEWEEFFSTDN